MKESKIGLWSLTALVFSSMVGAGIFSLPQNMADVAGARAVLIGWAVTGSAYWRWPCELPLPVAAQTRSSTAASTAMPGQVSASWWVSSPPGATGSVPPSAWWAIW